MEKVYFIGAGPGDPELITVKGQKIIKEADVIIYAGSLVPKEVIDCHKAGAEIYNSAVLNLEEVMEIMISAVKIIKKLQEFTRETQQFLELIESRWIF